MKKVLMVLALSFAGSFAHASTWSCQLGFSGRSQGLKLIVGQFRTEAMGKMNCRSSKGERFSEDVKVTMGTSLLSPAIGIGFFDFVGQTIEFGVGGNPDSAYGDYLVAQGQAAIIGGVGAFTAFRVTPPRLGVQVSLSLIRGIGVHLGIHKMRIEPAH